MTNPHAKTAIEPSVAVSRDGRVTVWHREDGQTVVDFEGRREDVDDPVLAGILRVLRGPDDEAAKLAPTHGEGGGDG